MVAAFACDDDVVCGQVVSMTGYGTVGASAEDDVVCGVALGASKGYGVVQVGGFATVPVSGTGVAVGYCTLLADGSGGLVQDDDGKGYLVVSVDSGSAVILL